MEKTRFGRENSNCKQSADKNKQSADKSKQSADEKVNNQLTKVNKTAKCRGKTRFLARKFKL